MNALLLSFFLVSSSPHFNPRELVVTEQPANVFNKSVDPTWLFIGMAVGSILSAFAVTGIFLLTTPRAFSR